MKVTDFKNLYEYAKTTDILNDEMFNGQMWIFFNLTEKQYDKMIKLILSQKPDIKNNRVTFKNGVTMKIDKKYFSMLQI